MSTLASTICVSAVLLALSGAGHRPSSATAYTPTAGTACQLVSINRETGDSVKRCPGVAGYSLLVLNSDDRVSLSIVTPGRMTLPLNFWDVVTPAFSTLAPKLEWTLDSAKGKMQPVAIIVRVHTVDQTDLAAPKPLSLLVVARIEGDMACVTARIPARQANASKTARAVALARDSACLSPLR